MSQHVKTNENNKNQPPQQPTKSLRRRCLYEILEVARSANQDELKLAYKKQARQWHPDRNLNNEEEATQRFKEINEAYEILSDKHERAWYDANRDAILRGIDKNEILKMKENDDYDPDINLMPYFNPFVFASFDDDDENGFYNVYSNAFQQIIEIERLSKKKTPGFGDSNLPYHKMKEFYEFWEEFESRRSFQFASKYNLNDAENRRIRKLMHKENRKLMDSKRKKWEQSILRLVAFVKKRDPRFRNYLIDLDKQRMEEEKKMQEYQREIDEIMKEESRKQRELEMEQHKQLLNDPEHQRLIEECEQSVYECVVCNKVFKSENAFTAHEASRKHLKALEHLKFQLQMEHDLIFEANDSNDDEEQVKASKDELKVNEQSKLDAMIAKQMAHQQNVENEEEEEEEVEDEDEEEYEEDENEEESNAATKKKKKKEETEDEHVDLDYLIAVSMEQEDIINALDTSQSDEATKEKSEKKPIVSLTDSEIIALLESGIDIESLVNTYPSLTKQYIIDLQSKTKARRGDKKWKKQNKKRKKRRNVDFEPERHNEPKEHNQAPAEEEEKLNEFISKLTTFHDKKTDYMQKQKQRNEANDGSTANEENVPAKKKRRRRKKAKEAQNQRNMNVGMKNSPNTAPKASHCKACDQTFGSKTKLYAHLKEYPQHALKSNH
eukprot:CAMPEP_0197038830 /NCGR_PEP_ID=MMETSP1384-20130603/15715_1 /TAXON_ID=29189 /ORGANISM="Ammonia sp." /LENGTH=666 /DNA_ID=CAMNT_0042469325 /DNA_START=141 /DNA_END=2141 /DNA_ORIENTATION=-